jgi:ribonucleoside-diphosphate reductase alpha chain
MDRGAVSGFRNSQVTVLAPTGTIGLLMDCDTTGVEPDFSLVKFKKLSGGGVLKIANQSVSGALRMLGYSKTDREEILGYLLGSNAFPEKGAGLSRESLRAKGFQDSDLDRIESLMPSCFDFSSLFTRSVLGEECFRRLQIPKEPAQSPGFPLLEFLGFTREEVSAAEELLCGRLSLEGAPGLRPEHLSVFDCAVPSGRHSTRSIAPLGHLLMMAAIQPFLSGAISKTVNLPAQATAEEIEALHLMAWKLGLKSIAVYRDGSKASQPLNRGRDQSRSEAPRLVRQELPLKRSGVVLDAKLGDRKVTLRTGEYPDGRLGEVIVDLDGADSEYRALLNCFLIAVSLGLQFGVPLKEWVDRFAFTHFDPSGSVTGHPGLRRATSLVDFVFRTLGIEYLGMDELSHVPGSGTLSRGESSGDALEDQIRALRMDAPPCDSCGHSTVRNGSCFRCLNCGNSIGCS